MDYMLGWLWAFALWGAILVLPFPRKDRRMLATAWFVKIIVTLLLFLAYEYRYGLDTDGYFQDILASDFHWTGLNLGNGTQNVRQLAGLHALIMPGSYHAAKVGFAWIGLVACYFFYRAAIVYLHREDERIFYAVCFFPSILLWSSLLGKEPIVLLGMGVYAYGAARWLRFRGWKEAVTIAAGCLVVALVRMWYLPLMLGSLAIANFLIERSSIRRWALNALICLGIVFSVFALQDQWKIQTTNEAFEFRTKVSAVAFSGGGSDFEAPDFKDPGGFIRLAPISIFRALFRPLPLEVRNVAGTLEGLENVFLLFLLWKAIRRTRWVELTDPTVFWVAVLVLLWGVFYGSVVANFGTLARYKLQIEPFLFGLLAYLSRDRKLDDEPSYA